MASGAGGVDVPDGEAPAARSSHAIGTSYTARVAVGKPAARPDSASSGSPAPSLSSPARISVSGL